MPKFQENASESSQASEDVILIDDSDDVDIDIGSETEVIAPKRKRGLQGSSQTPMSTKRQKDTCKTEQKSAQKATEDSSSDSDDSSDEDLSKYSSVAYRLVKPKKSNINNNVSLSAKEQSNKQR